MLQVINYSEKAIALVGDTKEIKDTLKAMGGRFNPRLSCGAGWIFSAKKREELERMCNGETAAAKDAPIKTRENKFGFKVGDVFTMSWGYDQTQNDFFQIIAILGDTSVRMRQVHPKQIACSPTCSMAADYTYQMPTNGELLDYPQSSIWIKDQEKGDIKRTVEGYGSEAGVVKFENHWAHKVNGSKIKVYESWYA